jgi:O-antigen/teichoic acid export membrane protein
VVVEAWSGQASGLSVGVLTLYALAWALVTPVQILVLMLVARGRHAVIGGIILAEALVNLALSIILVGSIGPIGAAVATLIAVAVDDILVIPLVATRLLEIPLLPIAVAGAAGLAAGAVLIGLVNLVPVGGVPGLAVRVLLGAIALATALWLVLPQRRFGVAGSVAP